MRRRLLIIAILLSTASLSAQGPLSPRWALLPVIGNMAPSVSILMPSGDGTFETQATAIQLTGVAADDEGVTELQWENQTTMESGTATLSGPGTNSSWDTGATSSSDTLASDSFTVAANTNLTGGSYTSTSGHTYTAFATGVTSGVMRAYSGTGSASVSGGADSQYTAVVLGVTIPAANYTVRLTTNYTTAGIPDATDALGFLINPIDSQNHCGVEWLGDAATVDLRIWKREASATATSLATASNVNVINGQTIDLVVTPGGGMAFVRAGVTLLSVTDGFCDNNLTGSGFYIGSMFGTAGLDAATQNRVDNFQIIYNGATGGIPLSLGVANTIRVRAKDTDGAFSPWSTIVVDQGVVDGEGPLLTVTTPAQDETTSIATVTPEGTVVDNVAATAGSCSCPTCTPTSRSMMITGTSWVATGSFTYAPNANVLTCVAEDAEANSSNSVVRNISYNNSDMTAPSVSISTNGGAPFDTQAQTVDLAGACTDNVTSGLVVTWTAPGGAGTASGSLSYTITAIPLVMGMNLITVSCRDAANNSDPTPATITVTRLVADLVISTGTMPSAVQGAAYGPGGAGVQLAASGGTGALSWREDPNQTTLNDSDPECAGLTVTAGGLVGGTSTSVATGTCSWTAFVSDSAGSPDTDTQALTITIVAVPVGGNSYFDTLVARTDTLTSFTFRGANHFKCGAQGGISSKCDDVTDYPGSYDASKDAMKIEIPQFDRYYDMVRLKFVEALNDTDTSTTATLVVYKTGLRTNSLQFPTGEIVTVTAENATTKQITFTRGLFGTTKQPLAAGTEFKTSRNGLQSSEQLRFYGCVGCTSSNAANLAVFPVADETTMVFTWEVEYDSTYVNSGLTNHKAFTLLYNGDNKWFEVKTTFANSTGSPCFVPGVTVASVDARIYNGVYTGAATWADSNGTQYGPGITAPDNLPGFRNQRCINVNTKTRFWLRVELRANDYDYVTMWIANSNYAPFKMFDALPLSAPRLSGWMVEQGTSTKMFVMPSASHVVRDWVKNLWIGRRSGRIAAGTFDDAEMATLMEQP